MADTNPFESPAETTQAISSGRAAGSMMYHAMIGGAFGLLIGVLGVAGLFLMFPGQPGAAELLILTIAVFIAFVLPGAVVGILVGSLSNSIKK